MTDIVEAIKNGPWYPCDNREHGCDMSFPESILNVGPEGEVLCNDCLDGQPPVTIALFEKWKSPEALEIEKLRAAQEWKPIENSPPKDGSKFDVYRAEPGRRFLDCWSDQWGHIWIATGYPSVETTLKGITHWRTLPEAPEEKP